MTAPAISSDKGEVRRFRTAAELGREAAFFFAEEAAAVIQPGGTFFVALSGGSTPDLVYRELIKPELASRLDWGQVECFLSDERCVPPDHPDSNYGRATRTLLSQVPIPPERVHRMRGEIEPQKAAEEYRHDLRRTFCVAEPSIPRFDLLLLGLGEDGHCASLFPGSPALKETRLAAANHIKKLNSWRLTLTFPIINAARNVVFLVAGERKAAVLRQVLIGGGESVPAERVHPVEGKLIWFVDDAAASRLD